MACPDVVPESRSLRKGYERHQPQNTVLYQVVQAWVGTFLRMASEAYEWPLPRYVRFSLDWHPWSLLPETRWILVHVKLPVSPDVLADGYAPAFDVSDQSIPDWLVGTNPEDSNPQHQPRGYERGPPCFDGVAPPCPDDCPLFDV